MQEDFIRILLIVTICSIILGFIPGVYALPYGRSTYQGGKYGVGLDTPGAGTSGTTTQTTTNTPICNKDKPSFRPNLYQVDRTSKNAILYFAPAGTPHDHYVIAYGRTQDILEFGVKFDHAFAPYALSYAISHLDPKEQYFFRIRAGNGCAPGEWSSVVKTATHNQTTPVSYYPEIGRSYISKLFSPNSSLVKDKKLKDPDKITQGSTKPKPVPTSEAAFSIPSNTPSFFDRLVQFVRRIFGLL